MLDERAASFPSRTRSRDSRRQVHRTFVAIRLQPEHRAAQSHYSDLSMNGPFLGRSLDGPHRSSASPRWTLILSHFRDGHTHCTRVWVSAACPQRVHAGEGVRLGPHLNSSAFLGYMPGSVCSTCLFALLVFIRDITSLRVFLPWLGKSSQVVVRGKCHAVASPPSPRITGLTHFAVSKVYSFRVHFL